MERAESRGTRDQSTADHVSSNGAGAGLQSDGGGDGGIAASVHRDGASSDVTKSDGVGKKPNTGKDHIPTHDGTITMREYQKRVRIFQTSTGIDPEYQGGKLLERLSGAAWDCIETLDVGTLKHPDGVERLLTHLWNELEPLEYLRTFTTLNEFYVKFQRSRGMEFTAYDSAFRAQCQRLREVGAPLEGLIQAFWFIQKANISEDLKRQVIAAAGGQYEYHRLRQALVAIVPQVKREHDDKGDISRWTRAKAHRVNAVMEWVSRNPNPKVNSNPGCPVALARLQDGLYGHWHADANCPVRQAEAA